MALKAFLDSLAGLDPKIAAEYKQNPEDQKYYLDVDGMVLKDKAEGKLKASNETNARLSAELEKIKAQLDQRVDKAEVQRLQSIIDDLENGRGGEKFKAAVAREIQTYKAAAEEQLRLAKESLATETSKRTAAESSLKRFKIHQAVQASAAEVGLKGKSAPHYLQLAERDFDIDPNDPKGERIIAVTRSFNAEGKEVLTPVMGSNLEPIALKEFISQKHRGGSLDVFFEQGSGSGAPSNARPSNTPGRFHLTREQARDTNLYQATKEAAAKAGQQVTIEPAAPIGGKT